MKRTIRGSAFVLALLLLFSLLPAWSLGAEPSGWLSYRGNENNLGVVSAKTPRTAAETAQRWAVSVGKQESSGGWSWYLPSTFLLVENKALVTSGDQLRKVDLATGTIEESVTMAASRDYAYLPPVCAEGMLFVPLSGGIVQAFDAETLASLWVSAGVTGQALSAITYADGRLYTGFWNGETQNGHFVCLSAGDDDPAQTDEVKQPIWTKETPGGYYWTGAYCRDGYVAITSDNGTGTSDAAAEGKLTVYQCSDGTERSSMTIVGDGRSAIACDPATGRLYFTTKAGYLYSFTLSAEGVIEDLQSQAYAGESTSTPVIYNGRVYFGMNGTARVVVANAETLAEINTIPMDAYPQGALLLSNAYESSTGSVYLYGTYNTTPGGVTVIRDQGGQTAPAGSALFIPEAEQQNYCVSSLLCGADGTVYYTNDSGALFAVGVKEPEHCPVDIQVSPAGAFLTVKNSSETEMSPIAPYHYDLPEDTYSYTVSQSGYVTKTGTFSVSSAEDTGHTAQTQTVELSRYIPSGGSDLPALVQISVTVLGDTMHGTEQQHTYLQNSDTLPRFAETRSVAMAEGKTAFDALLVALNKEGLSYEAKEGYVSSINGLSQQANGVNSGWMYQVNGVFPQVSSSAYPLKDGDTVVWFYTDDYQKETAEPSPEPEPLPEPSPEPAPTPQPTPEFTDVSEDHWAKLYIDTLFQKGVIQGKSETEFAPEDSITRAECLALLFRLSGETEPEEPLDFADVEAADWFAPAVRWGVQAGITKGTSKTEFSPNAPIRREDLALMLLRYAANQKLVLPDDGAELVFADEDDIRTDAKPAVEALVKAGIFTGKDGGRFDPKGTATRAEAAKVLCLLSALSQA